MGGQVSIVTKKSQIFEQTSDHRNSYAAVVKNTGSLQLQVQGKFAFKGADCSKKVTQEKNNSDPKELLWLA